MVQPAGAMAGRAASRTTVHDTTPPALARPSDQTADGTGPAGAVATFTASATDLVDGAVAVTCVPGSGSTFAAGSTLASCLATDGAGTTATGSVTIALVDTTPPVVTLPVNQTMEETDGSLVLRQSEIGPRHAARPGGRPSGGLEHSARAALAVR